MKFVLRKIALKIDPRKTTHKIWNPRDLGPTKIETHEITGETRNLANY